MTPGHQQLEGQRVRRIIIIISCLLTTPLVSQADERAERGSYSPGQKALQWQVAHAEMQQEHYLRSTRQNLEMVQQGVSDWARRTLDDSGSYGTAASLLGTTLGIAAADQRYHLNDDRTVGLVLRDSTRSKRALLLEFRKTW